MARRHAFRRHRPTAVIDLKEDVAGLEKIGLALIEMHGIKKIEKYFNRAMRKRLSIQRRPWYSRAWRRLTSPFRVTR